MCATELHTQFQERLSPTTRSSLKKKIKEMWEEAMCVELGRLVQGYKTTAGTNTTRFISHDMIQDIPKNQTVTYGRIMIDYRPQKKTQIE